MPADWTLLLSCEHGGYEIPQKFRPLLSPADAALLPTHRGWDQGALEVAERLAKALGSPLHAHVLSRLLVDCNRTLSHKSCFGPSYRHLDAAVKKAIAESCYWPYRRAVEGGIAQSLKAGQRVLHIAVHSFVPVLDGVVRNADFGLLYDPGRSSEKQWADKLLTRLKQQAPEFKTRRNYPYLGKSDGFTSYLRKLFPQSKYAGFEVEFNQTQLASTEMIEAMAKMLERLLRGSPELKF